MRKIKLFIACSLDGYIATKDQDISFLNAVQKEGEDYGYESFTDSIDTVIVGRKTYDKVVALGYPNPHPTKTFYVISRQEHAPVEGVHFYSGDLISLINKLKNESGKDVFIDGGAELIHHLLQHELIDEFVISFIPVLLGDGVRLFKDGRNSVPLTLKEAKSFDSGLVQVRYVK